MFKETIPKLFPDFTCEFKLIDTLLGNLITKCQHTVGTLFDVNGPLLLVNGRHILDEYDAIVCGGGDLFNHYFMKTVQRIVQGYQKPVYALGMGIPFPSLLRMREGRAYLNIFDHIFLRERSDLPLLTRSIGARYSHYLPDMGFLKKPRIWYLQEDPSPDLSHSPQKLLRQKIKQRISKVKHNPNNTETTIGVFLVQNLDQNENRLTSLFQLLEHAQQYGRIKLVRFCTLDSRVRVDDGILNSSLAERLTAHVENDLTEYSADEMIDLMANLDMAICGRFHAHIFATIAGCPFMSVANTRKVKLFLDEDIYNLGMSKDKSRVLGIPKLSAKEEDVDDMIITFNRVWSNRSIISKRLAEVARRNHFLLQTRQVNNLLLRKDRRLREPEVDYEKVYQNARKMLFQLTSVDPESSIDAFISKSAAQKVAAQICYEITGEPSSRYEWGAIQRIRDKPEDLRMTVQWIYEVIFQKRFQELSKLDLGYFNQSGFDGLHRAGWQYVLTYLKTLNSSRGILADTYIDRTFIWGHWNLDRTGVIPYTSMWIGFAHHTPNTEYSDNNAKAIIQSDNFKRSLPTCQGIVCLSDYLARWYRIQIRKLGYNIPVISLHHPTLFVPNKWNPSKVRDYQYSENPTINLVNVGAWYRNPFSIYRLDAPEYIKKKFLKWENMESYLPPENLIINPRDIRHPHHNNKWMQYCCMHIRDIFQRKNSKRINTRRYQPTESGLKEIVEQIKTYIPSVEVIDGLSNDKYDKLLAESVVFLDLVDASAVNTLIECIVRETPILVNRHPAIEEYLGKEYPLFYESLDEATTLLEPVRILAAHEYLRAMDKTQLHIETFLSKLVSSDLYQKLFQLE